MLHFTRFPLAIATIATLGFGGSTALAESPAFPGTIDEIVVVLPCNPATDICPQPEPDPDPELNPAIPPGPGDLTDDPCDPAEGPCGDPEDPTPIPEGPGSFTDDPCDPVVQDCGDGGGDPEPDPDPDPDPQPEPEPCTLDDVCTRTPTFTA
ncbi:hypothetical protein [Ilumatobacter sp.]|uniref:hypothetical protein n=1 Tax=Ilumatobacter sp. TaxID=1967498 RepID=UPI003C359294